MRRVGVGPGVWRKAFAGAEAELPPPQEEPAVLVSGLIATGTAAINRGQGTDFYLDPTALLTVAALHGKSVYDFTMDADIRWQVATNDARESYNYDYLPSWFPFPPTAGLLFGPYAAHVYRYTGDKTVRVTLWHYDETTNTFYEYYAERTISVTERTVFAGGIGVLDPLADWASAPTHDAANRFTTWAAALAWLNGRAGAKLLLREGRTGLTYKPSVPVDLERGTMIELYGGAELGLGTPVEMQVIPDPFAHARWRGSLTGGVTSWVTSNKPTTPVVLAGARRLDEGVHYEWSGNTLTLLPGHGCGPDDEIGVWPADTRVVKFIDTTPSVPTTVFQGLPLTLPQADCELLIGGVAQASGWELIGENLRLDTPVSGSKVTLQSRPSIFVRPVPAIFALDDATDAIVSGIKAWTTYDPSNPEVFDGRNVATASPASSAFVYMKSTRVARLTFSNLDLSGFEYGVSAVLSSTPPNYGLFMSNMRIRNWSNYAAYDSGWTAACALGVCALQNPLARSEMPGKDRNIAGKICSCWHGAYRSPSSFRGVINKCAMSSRTSWAENDNYGIDGGLVPQPVWRLATSQLDYRSFAASFNLGGHGNAHFGASPPNTVVAAPPVDPVVVASNVIIVPELGDQPIGGFGAVSTRNNIFYGPDGRPRETGTKGIWIQKSEGPNLLKSATRATAGPHRPVNDTVIVRGGNPTGTLRLTRPTTFGTGNIESSISRTNPTTFGPVVLTAGMLIDANTVRIPVKLTTNNSKADKVLRLHRSPTGALADLYDRDIEHVDQLATRYTDRLASVWRDALGNVVPSADIGVEPYAVDAVVSVDITRLAPSPGPQSPMFVVGETLWLTTEHVEGGIEPDYQTPPEDWDESDGLEPIPGTGSPGNDLLLNPVTPIEVPAATLHNVLVSVDASKWATVIYREGSPEPVPDHGPLDAVGRPAAGSGALGTAVGRRSRVDVNGALRPLSGASKGALEPGSTLAITELYRVPAVTAAWARVFEAGDTATVDDVVVTITDPGFPAITLDDIRVRLRVVRGPYTLRPASTYVLQADDTIKALVDVPTELGAARIVSPPAQLLTGLSLLRNTAAADNEDTENLTASHWTIDHTGVGFTGPNTFAMRFALEHGWTGTNRRLLSGGTNNVGLRVSPSGQVTLDQGGQTTAIFTAPDGEMCCLVVSLFPGEAITARTFYRIGTGPWVTGPTSTRPQGLQFSTNTTQLFNGAAGKLRVVVDTGMLWLTGAATGTPDGVPPLDALFDPITARPTVWPVLEIPGCSPAAVVWGLAAWNSSTDGNVGADSQIDVTRSGSGMVRLNEPPAMTASATLNGRDLIISVTSLTGFPEPTVDLTTLTLAGVNVIGDVVDADPWHYEGPSFTPPDRAIVWEVTATNAVDSVVVGGTLTLPADVLTDADVSAWNATLRTPLSTPRLAAMSDFVTALKAGGVWSKLTHVWPISAVDFADLLDRPLKGAQTAALVGFASGDYSPTVGLTAPASGNVAFDSGVQLQALAQDDCSIAVIRTNATTTGQIIGSGGSVGRISYVISTNSARMRFTTGVVPSGMSTGVGPLVLSRRASTEFQAIGPATGVITTTAASDGTGGTNRVALFSANSGGSTSQAFGASAMMLTLGTGLSDLEMVALRDAMEAYRIDILAT